MSKPPSYRREGSDQQAWRPCSSDPVAMPVYTQARLDNALKVFRKARYLHHHFDQSRLPPRQLRAKRVFDRSFLDSPILHSHAWENVDLGTKSDGEYDPDYEKKAKRRQSTDTKRSQKRKSDDTDPIPRQGHAKRPKHSTEDESEQECNSLRIVLRMFSNSGFLRFKAIRDFELNRPMILRNGKVSQRKLIAYDQKEECLNGEHEVENYTNELQKIYRNENSIEGNIRSRKDSAHSGTSSTRALSPLSTRLSIKPFLAERSYTLTLENGNSVDSAIIIDDNSDTDKRNESVASGLGYPFGRTIGEQDTTLTTEVPLSYTPPTDEKVVMSGLAQDATIMTHFAHPIDLKYASKPGTLSQCSFCLNYKMGVIGYPLRQVRVRIYPDQPYKYHELGEGYRSLGKPTTKMCRDCAIDRLMILHCHDPDQGVQEAAVYEKLPDEREKVDAYVQDIKSAIRYAQQNGATRSERARPLTYSKSTAPWPSCSLCPGPAMWRCTKKQETKRHEAFSNLRTEDVGTETIARENFQDDCTSIQPIRHQNSTRSVPSASSELSPAVVLTGLKSSLSCSNVNPTGRSLIPLFIMSNRNLQSQVLPDSKALSVESGCGLYLCDTCYVFFTSPADPLPSSEFTIRAFAGCGNVLHKDALRFFLRRNDVAVNGGTVLIQNQDHNNNLAVTTAATPRNVLGPRADLELLWPGGMLEKAYEDEGWRTWSTARWRAERKDLNNSNGALKSYKGEEWASDDV